ncbi:MAG: hypothetical protein L3J14_09270 [Flavobacteriaceae bacterium]|nr:hypothetical protein [Flavobacteriaceae bacterium]
MKTLLSIVLGSTILLSIAQCGNSKEVVYKIQKETSFKIVKATYKEWVAGVRGGGSGVNVFFIIDSFDSSKITLDSVFFRGQKAKIETNNSLYIGRFKTNVTQQPDIIMSSDTNAEYGNKPPTKKIKFPLNLKENEAIISYKEDGKQKYYKQELQREEPDHYP